MLEAVEELLELLELEKTLLLEERELPAELLERMRLASASVGEVAVLLRTHPPAGGPEARALKAKIEQRFVRAFRLSRENEQKLRSPESSNVRQPVAPLNSRPAVSVIEKRYRERMRHGVGSSASIV